MKIIILVAMVATVSAQEIKSEKIKDKQDDWPPEVNFLVSSPFVRWAQLATNPKKFTNTPIWISGYLYVDNNNGQYVFRIFDSPSSLKDEQISESCIIVSSEILSKDSEKKVNWSDYNGLYIVMQGDFEYNPSWIDGDEYGKFNRPLYIRIKDKKGLNKIVVRPSE